MTVALYRASAKLGAIPQMLSQPIRTHVRLMQGAYAWFVRRVSGASEILVVVPTESGPDERRL